MQCLGRSEIFAMKNGMLIKEGIPSDIITSQTIEEIYGLKSVVITDPVSCSPMIIPISSHDDLTNVNIVRRSHCV